MSMFNQIHQTSCCTMLQQLCRIPTWCLVSTQVIHQLLINPRLRLKGRLQVFCPHPYQCLPPCHASTAAIPIHNISIYMKVSFLCIFVLKYILIWLVSISVKKLVEYFGVVGLSDLLELPLTRNFLLASMEDETDEEFQTIPTAIGVEAVTVGASHGDENVADRRQNIVHPDTESE